MESREDDRLEKFVLKYKNYFLENDHPDYQTINFTLTKTLRDTLFTKRVEQEEGMPSIFSKVKNISVDSDNFALIRVYVHGGIHFEITVQKFFLIAQTNDKDILIDVLREFFIENSVIPNTERIQCIIESIPEILPLKVCHEQDSYSVSKTFSRFLIGNLLTIWEEEDMKLIENMRASIYNNCKQEA